MLQPRGHQNLILSHCGRSNRFMHVQQGGVLNNRWPNNQSHRSGAGTTLPQALQTTVKSLPSKTQQRHDHASVQTMRQCRPSPHARSLISHCDQNLSPSSLHLTSFDQYPCQQPIRPFLLLASIGTTYAAHSFRRRLRLLSFLLPPRLSWSRCRERVHRIHSRSPRQNGNLAVPGLFSGSFQVNIPSRLFGSCGGLMHE
jgi:hypothetical protein